MSDRIDEIRKAYEDGDYRPHWEGNPDTDIAIKDLLTYISSLEKIVEAAKQHLSECDDMTGAPELEDAIREVE